MCDPGPSSKNNKMNNSNVNNDVNPNLLVPCSTKTAHKQLKLDLAKARKQFDNEAQWFRAEAKINHDKAAIHEKISVLIQGVARKLARPEPRLTPKDLKVLEVFEKFERDFNDDDDNDEEENRLGFSDAEVSELKGLAEIVKPCHGCFQCSPWTGWYVQERTGDVKDGKPVITQQAGYVEITYRFGRQEQQREVVQEQTADAPVVEENMTNRNGNSKPSYSLSRMHGRLFCMIPSPI